MSPDIVYFSSKPVTGTGDVKYDQEYACTVPIKTNEEGGTSIRFSIHGLPENFEGGEWKITRSQNCSTRTESGEISKSTNPPMDSDVGVLNIPNVRVSCGNQTSWLNIRVSIFYCVATSCGRKIFNFKFILNNEREAETLDSVIQVVDFSYNMPSMAFKV
jgi:hypothetical protein